MKNVEAKALVIGVIIVVVLLVIFPILLLLSVDSISFVRQPSFRGDVKVYGDIYLEQEIYPQHNNLQVVAMSIKNPNLLNKNDITMNIFDGGGNEARSVTLSGLNISGGSPVKFVFDPIVDSKDKKYVLSIYSPKSQEFESMSIFQTNEEISWIGDFKVNGELRGEKIALQAFYAPESHTNLVKSVYKMSVIKFIKDIPFALFYCFVILLLLIYVVRKQRQ